MSSSASIKFQNFIPKKFYLKSSKIKFYSHLKTIQKNLNSTKDTFSSFGKKFSLNIKLKELNTFKKYNDIIIIGMGGSIHGSQATYFFLEKKVKKRVFFLNNLSQEETNKTKIIKNLKKAMFLIISKSGNTLETLSLTDYFKNSLNSKNTLIITEKKSNSLYNFAKKKNIKIISHRNYIGGRYSIFSETGLIPIYLMGYNIIKLKKNILTFLKKDKEILKKNLFNLFKIYSSKKINSLILLSYCSELDHFLLWCQQLIAESLGKNKKGIIPIISKGPRDHHSLLQLYLDGPKDKFFYVFSERNKNKTKLGKRLFPNILNNSNLDKVVTDQKNAFLQSLKKKDIPFISIELNKRDEETLGKLFSYFIFETVIIGKNLNLNPFNQPAVEGVKILTKQNLFKKNQI